MSNDDLMYDNHIELQATRSDEEPFRIDRLNRVIGYVYALAESQGNRKILGKVERLHDHKGTLTVTWRNRPNEEEKRYFLRAWESVIGDGADNVEHSV